MNSTVRKYIEYIDEKLREIGKNPVFKQKPDRELMMSEDVLEKITAWCFYDSLKECLISGNKTNNKIVVTDQFKSVSESLLGAPLNAREKTDILFYLIERNISSGGILDSTKVNGLVKYDKFFEYGINPNVVNALFNSGRMEELIYTSDDLLDCDELKMKDIIKKCIILLDKNNPFVKCHQRINDSYLTKKDSYEKEDIDEIGYALFELEIDDALCDMIKYVLTNRLEKRKRKEEQKNNSINKNSNIKDMMSKVSKSETETSKKYLSEKEYKQIKKETLTYFDIYKGIPTRDLSYDEILYCASLLFKIGTEDDIVRALYDRSSYTSKQLEQAQEKPLATYLAVYDKLKFYEEKLELEEHLTLLENYFQETFLSKNEDYPVWKQAISEELSEVLQKIPEGYKYEMQRKSQHEKNRIKFKSRNTKN